MSTTLSDGKLFPAHVSAILRCFDASGIVSERRLSQPDDEFSFGGGKWRVSHGEAQTAPGHVRQTIRAELVGGACESAVLSLEVALPEWSVKHYLLVPGVVYNGNRFRVDAQSYPPIFKNSYNEGPDTPPVITDILRLNIGLGPSRFSLLAGALTVPVIGMFDPEKQSSLLVLTKPFSTGRETGYEFEENEDRSVARLIVSSPGVRLPFRYTMCTTQTPSEDGGANLRVGESLEVVIETRVGPCEDVPALFEQILQNRAALAEAPVIAHGLPFSAAWEILQEKYNRDNWVDGDGYYAVGMQGSRFDDFQIGWVGGLMSTLPLLQDGSELSRERARKAIDFVFSKGGQGASGFFHGIYHQGKWSGDGYDDNQWALEARPNPALNHYHLLRKSADALYFLLKQFELLKKQDPLRRIPSSWETGTRACADAFVKLWRENHQLGQFVDIHTGEIIAGGTPSAGTAPAGLALAARYFAEPAYLDAAVEIAAYFENTFTDRGLTIGGPGEILQSPDFESSILESTEIYRDSFVVRCQQFKNW